MGIELSLDPLRQEGRLARPARRDFESIPPSTPDRLRDPGDFATIFQNRTETRLGSLPQPDPAATGPVSRADTADAPEPEELTEDAETLTDWIQTEDTTDPRAETELLIAEARQNASELDLTESELAIALVPVALRGAETSPSRAEITASFAPPSKGQEPTAQTPPPQIQPGHGAVALMALRGATAANPDTVSAGVLQNQAAPNPATPSATVINPAVPSPIASLSPAMVANPLSRPLVSAPTSAAAARFSAALSDRTTQPPAGAIQSQRPPQIHLPQPVARSEAVAPMPERTVSVGPTHPLAKEGSGPLLPSTNTTAPVLPQPLAVPQLLALAPMPTEPTDQRTGERRLVSHVGTQLLQAATTSGPNTELQLNPVELGRVRLNLQAIDSTITVTIMAERPETADLMRRHVDTLVQEFRALGYQDVNVSVGQRQTGAGQGSAPDTGQNDTHPVPDPIDDQPLPQSPHNRPGLSASGSLDLRL